MAYAMIGFAPRPKKEFISSAPFNTAFYSYTMTGPQPPRYQPTGKLELLPNLTTANCPAGRILRESGRYLYPGANPGLQAGETNYQVGFNHIWTKVYDAVTGLSGFIDANSPIFAYYSDERPEEFVDLGEQDGSESRKGPPIYTDGVVQATDNITSTEGNIAATIGSVSAGTTVTAGTSVTAGTYIAGAVVTPLIYATGMNNTPFNPATLNNSADLVVNPTLGNVFYLDLSPSTYNNLNGSIYLYCGAGETGSGLISVTPPAGTSITLLIKSNAAATTGGPGAHGPTVRPGNIKLVPNSLPLTSLYASMTFVSNGVLLIQTSYLDAIAL